MGKSPENKKRDTYTATLALFPNACKSEKLIEFNLIMVDSLCGAIYSPGITSLQQTFIETNRIKLADNSAAKGGFLDINILVGQDYYHNIVQGEKIFITGGLVLLQTIAGYSLAGTSSLQSYTEDTSESSLGLFRVHSDFPFDIQNQKLDNIFDLRNQELESIKKLVALETLGVGPLEEEISPVLDRFNHTTTHNGERYSAFLPKRSKKLKKLTSNFVHTFKRLINGYQQLLRPDKENDLNEYSKIMKEQLESGVLERVACIGTINEVQNRLEKDPTAFDNINVSYANSIVHYLPHFSVRKNSTGKMRLVYDAAAKTHSKSLSLNDCLETGPDLINSLISILIRFRLHKFALKSDIEKAFLQIEIEETDRDLLRTLWIENGLVMIYRFARLPFGITCAPFILAATLSKHLSDTKIPDEKKYKILESFYVDDNVSGADTYEELIELKSSLQDIFSHAGMTLRQFNSNNPELRNLLSSTEENIPDVETVLGIKWNVINDTLGINCKHVIEPVGPKKGRKRNPQPNTKRGVYSRIARTYDILGLISPFMFRGKLLLRDICESTDVKSWDLRLPEKLTEPWNKWEQQLTFLDQLQVPRFISLENARKISLAGFSDASKAGFAACIYFIVENKDRKIISNLLVSKTHVAPKNLNSIPRLELCGALLLANLLSHVKNAIKNIDNSNIFLFTDSADVLFWIRSSSLDWPIFVANRLKQIHSLSDVESWKHVSSNENPADIPSRGCNLDTLINDLETKDLWFYGPKWLKDDINNYKSSVDLKIIPPGCQEELSKTVLTNKICHPTPSISSIIEINRFSSFNKLIRVTKLVLKAAQSLSSTLNKNNKESLRYDGSEAEVMWIRAIQKEYYNDFFVLAQDLEKTKSSFSNISAESKNKFATLSIFLDKELKILRCHSRIQTPYHSYSTANPILLPSESPFTTLMIKRTHERLLHAGKSQTVATIRSEFWIPRLTKLTSKILNNCMNCKKTNGPTYQLPPSPDLPEFRIQKMRTFANVGLDYAGPFTTRERFVDKTYFDYKSYILIFTCTSSRGVHFEATNSLNSGDFNLAINRFTSERGRPDLLISDNAKTFETASKKFKALSKDKHVTANLNQQRMQWHFYTEKAPWMGGFIERVVGLFKQHFHKIARTNLLSFEEFRTVVKSSQAVINSRPLTYLCEGLDEGIPLTPSMLIHGYNITDLPAYSNVKLDSDGSKKSNEFTLGERYAVLERAKSSFWNIWSTHYLTELNNRHMRLKKSKNNLRIPKVGDVCLLRKEKIPRNKWPLARIERIDISSRDKQVRTVGIRTINENGKPSFLNRSPTFLVPLEEDLIREHDPNTSDSLIEL